MNLTSKQRSYLTGLSNNVDPIFQIGKSGLTPEICQALSDALEARELIKITILKNCMDEPRAIAEMISERTRSTVVRVIGRKIILYRPSKIKKKIELPRE